MFGWHLLLLRLHEPKLPLFSISACVELTPFERFLLKLLLFRRQRARVFLMERRIHFHHCWSFCVVAVSLLARTLLCALATCSRLVSSTTPSSQENRQRRKRKGRKNSQLFRKCSLLAASFEKKRYDRWAQCTEFMYGFDPPGDSRGICVTQQSVFPPVPDYRTSLLVLALVQ